MELPRHNPLIRGIYLLAILMMFLFMALVIKSYWPNNQQMSHWNDQLLAPIAERLPAQDTAAAQPEVNLPMRPTAPATNVENNTQYELVRRANKVVIGLPFTLRLNEDMETQLRQVWRQFYNHDDLHKDPNVKSKSKILLVYQHFNSAHSNIEIVIGYAAKNSSQSSDFSLVEIPAGDFLKAKSVLDVWNDPPKTAGVLNYQKDYESYILDREFNVISQTAYVRVTR